MTYLEKPEMNALLNAPDRRTEQGQRDYALMLFLYNTGARADEAAHITIGDLDLGTSSSVKINGKPLLACELLVENAVEYFQTTIFTVEPIEVAPVVRDLVVDIERAYEKVESVKPYIIDPAPPPPDGRLHSITPEKLEHYVNATRCINCLCCASACISSHETFLGPNAMLACIIRLMDPREQEKQQRKKTLYSDAGVYRCHSSEACSHVCPKEIDVAHFIALAKEGRFKPND